MAVLHEGPSGRDFKASELAGQQIRIEIPPDVRAVMVTADGEVVGNVSKIVLTAERNSIVEATLTLSHEHETEEVVLRDNVEFSFSAIAEEVQ